MKIIVELDFSAHDILEEAGKEGVVLSLEQYYNLLQVVKTDTRNYANSVLQDWIRRVKEGQALPG